MSYLLYLHIFLFELQVECVKFTLHFQVMLIMFSVKIHQVPEIVYGLKSEKLIATDESPTGRLTAYVGILAYFGRYAF